VIDRHTGVSLSIRPAVRQPNQGRQPAAVLETQIKFRMRRVKASLGESEPGGAERRVPPARRPSLQWAPRGPSGRSVGDPYSIASIDVDVLYLDIVHELLQPARPKRASRTACASRCFLDRFDGSLAQCDTLSRHVAKPCERELAGEFASICECQLSRTGRRQIVGHVRAQTSEQ